MLVQRREDESVERDQQSLLIIFSLVGSLHRLATLSLGAEGRVLASRGPRGKDTLVGPSVDNGEVVVGEPREHADGRQGDNGGGKVGGANDLMLNSWR